MFEALKSCLLQAPILGFPTEAELFVLDMDASLFAVGGILNQIQGDREVVIAYASKSLRQSQRQNCTTPREMRLAFIVHAFNYRVAVLRDGAKAAVRTARSRRAERGFASMGSAGGGDVSNRVCSCSGRTGSGCLSCQISRSFTKCGMALGAMGSC